MIVVVATSNPGKLREIRAILGERLVELRSLADFPAIEFPAEGVDYRQNAIAKAETAARRLGVPALGEDSGLEVDALGGEPGPLSARFGGPGLDDVGRLQLLLERLEGTPVEARGARFVCHAAIAAPGREPLTARGVCEGRILSTATGDGGFGYDPVFQPIGHDESMAQLADHVKNRISHRARALLSLWPEWEAAAAQ